MLLLVYLDIVGKQTLYIFSEFSLNNKSLIRQFDVEYGWYIYDMYIYI